MKMCYFLFHNLVLLFILVLLKSNPTNTILSCFIFCISFIFRNYVCTDQQGDNPFEDLRYIVGKTVESTIEYTENTVLFEYGNTTLYTRVNDDGCNVIPTTLPPTLPPTTQPPTTQPTTQPPTPQPTTQPPTPAPKPNHLWMWIWISCGVVVLIVIIIVIVQCSKKPSKHEELEKKPLV